MKICSLAAASCLKRKTSFFLRAVFVTSVLPLKQIQGQGLSATTLPWRTYKNLFSFFNNFCTLATFSAPHKRRASCQKEPGTIQNLFLNLFSEILWNNLIFSLLVAGGRLETEILASRFCEGFNLSPSAGKSKLLCSVIRHLLQTWIFIGKAKLYVVCVLHLVCSAYVVTARRLLS